MLLVMGGDYLWPALYHYTHPPLILVAVTASYAALLYGFARLASRAWPLGTVWVLDFLSLQLFGLVALRSMRRLKLLDGALPLPLKLALVVGTVGGALWLLRRLGKAYRVRMLNGILAAGVMFTLAPFAAVELTAETRTFPLRAGSQAAPNVAIILLDELGDAASAPIAAALTRQGLQVRHKSLAPLGANTVNVIPALLTGRDFSNAQPCSLSAICSDTNILDFSRMSSLEPQLDIIGFHHPYCRIVGLRFCHKTISPSFEDPFVWFACSMMSSAYRRPIGLCDRRLLTVSQMNAARRDIEQAAASAPFWRQGGVLFVHIPLPHPPGPSGSASLDADYAANLVSAADYIDALSARLRVAFGDRFALVISSDHSLRPEVWCPMARYATGDCRLRPEFMSRQVPLLVATPALPPPLDGINNMFEAADLLRAARR
ncbi:hypothetical protein GCM10027277_22270 [Pseudoduganella ginsengisoli]